MDETKPEPYTTTPEHAAKMADWLATRGGLALWESADASDPTFSMTSPVYKEDGTPYTKPHWKLRDAPARIITDAAEVQVGLDKEVKRFHVAVRRGGEGLTLKLTDGSTRKVRKAVEQAGEGAYYLFDYMAQEAVIMAPEKVVPLREWLAQQPITNLADLCDWLSADEPDALNRRIFKATECGASISLYLVDGRTIHNGDPQWRDLTRSTMAWAFTIQTIVEGSDVTVDSDKFEFPVERAKVQEFIDWMEAEAKELWNEANAPAEPKEFNVDEEVE